MKKIICSLCLVFISCGHYTYVGRSTHSNYLFTAKGTFYGPKEWFTELLKSEKKPVILTGFSLSEDLLFNQESLERPGMPKVRVLYAMHHKSRYWLKVVAFGPSFDSLQSITRAGDRVTIVMKEKPAPIVFEWQPEKKGTSERWVMIS